MIKAVVVGVKHHVNLGNYESMEIEAQVTLDAEDQDFEQVRAEAQVALQTLLADSFQAQKNPAWFASIPTKRARSA